MSVPIAAGGGVAMSSLCGGVVSIRAKHTRRSPSVNKASVTTAAASAGASSSRCRPSVSSHLVNHKSNNRHLVIGNNNNNNNNNNHATTRAARVGAATTTRRVITTRTKASATPSSGGGGDTAAAAAAAAAVADATPPPPPAAPAKGKKRPFIPALDSTRFFLISYIAVGHFIACCTKDPFTLRLLSQVNVVVGAFFVLSGYVVAYTCTELGQYKASPRISPAPQFIMSRIMGYYPLYLLAQVLFAPVFIYADNL